MFSRLKGPIAAAMAVVIAGGILSGCAEINKRGGLVAQIEDWVLFHARTKSHRLLRSYVLIGALAAVARNAGIADIDKDSVSGRLKGALEIAQDAYDCLYPQRARVSWNNWDSKNALPKTVSAQPPIGCIFFDERMTRLDYAIYKLAVDVMLDPDSRALFADVRDRMIGEVPVVGSAVRTVTKAIGTAKEAATVAFETTSLADSLIRLSFKSSKRYVYLAPIYRDALELDMRLVLNSIREQCGFIDATQVDKTKKEDKKMVLGNCKAVLDQGTRIFDEGDGNLDEWRAFLREIEGSDEVGRYRLRVEAYPIHFAYVSRWIFYSCSELFAGKMLAPGRIGAGLADKDKKDKKNEKAIAEATAVVKAVEKVINDRCSPLIDYQPLTADFPFKVAYRPLNGHKDHEILNVNTRITNPPVRPAKDVDPASAKARGQAPK